MKKFYLFIAILFSSLVTLAEDRNKKIIEYFLDNNLIEFLISGGYYTLGIIATLTVVSMIFKTFRRVILSIILAIFGLLLVLFVFESLNNLEWIPSMY